MSFWVAGAVVGGALISSSAAGNAADTQAQSTQAGINEQGRQFDLTRSDYAPYRAAGTAALGQLQTDINKPTTAADVTSDPGYQFGLDQGQQALDRKIAAMGGRVSGAALKASARYGTDYASTGYGAAYQRRQDRLNRLAALAGVGQTATGGSAAAGANAANQISQMTTSQGDATAASQLARGNIWSNAGNQIAALYGRQQPGAGAPAGGGIDPYNFLGGASTAGDYSDVRLKTEIEPLGIAPNGLPLYRFRYVWGGPVRTGHMAHEVREVFPDAVSVDARGFLMVDYSKV